MGTYLGSRGSDGWQGVTLGIVGLGRVGGRVATLLRGWNMRIIACDPYISDSRFQELGVTKVDLPTLLAESDVITLHTFLNKETRHLIDAAAFARMKRGVVFLNASRGAVVDEPALIRALESGQVGCAGLDVFEHEPLAMDSPLRKMGNKVLLSPHMISSNVGSGLGPGIHWATDSVLHALRGEVPDNVFNKEVIPAWNQRFGGRSLI
jgi:D-3-phosphoglycerate dehydrogenase / 2-oxoglutarate reductase